MDLITNGRLLLLPPMLTFKHYSGLAWVTWLLVLAVFVTDLLIPRQYHIVFAYLLAHFLAISFREKSDVLLLAVVTTVLTIIGVAFKPHDAPLNEMLFERLPAVVSFWAAAFFVVQFIKLREEEERNESRFEALFKYATNGLLMANPGRL